MIITIITITNTLTRRYIYVSMLQQFSIVIGYITDIDCNSIR